MIGKPQPQQHQLLQLQRQKPHQQQSSLEQPTSPTAITSSDTNAPASNNNNSNYGVEEEEEEEDDQEEPEDEEEDDEDDEEEEEESQEDPSSPPLLPVAFSVGELVWGAARGHPSLPGKVVSAPRGESSSAASGDGRKSNKKKNNLNKSVWVRWFGGRPVIELVAMESLKSLSEGLDAHHKALKDTRK